MKKWDINKKQWYCEQKNLDIINNYLKRYYLKVFYKEKDIAKNLGAKWDSEKKQWYFKYENLHLLKKIYINIYFNFLVKYSMH